MRQGRKYRNHFPPNPPLFLENGKMEHLSEQEGLKTKEDIYFR